MQRHPLVHNFALSLVREALPRNCRLPLIHRLRLEKIDKGRQDELARDARLALVEAALIAADEPVPARRLAAAAGIADLAEVRRLVNRLGELYDKDGTAFQVDELAGGYQLLTRAEYHPWLARLRRAGADMRLSQAARETLAIVAYRQPIPRADLEKIRGVQSGEILRLLMEKGLARIAGREETLGRPVLYGTTKKFLQIYGLKSLKDLPATELSRPGEEKSPDGEEIDAAAPRPEEIE